jgi:hypothetical protein
MTETDEPPEPWSTRSSGRYLRMGVLLAAVLGAAALGVWAIWLSGTTGSQPAAGPDRPPEASPAVQTVPGPQPGEGAGESADARARRGKARPARAAEPAMPPPAPVTGTLQVDSDVPGASVFLDREFKGAAPVTIENVPAGSHRLNVSAEGFEGYAETIDLPVGPSSVVVRFKEVRLNESVPVVHKHTRGSCEGRLVADPQGIRYETSNKDDAFVMKHAEIEVCEVDYLKKNLRIKRRGGRTYNFSNDNADVLFVFHKNVQAARTRLAKGDAPAAPKGK